MRRIQFTPDLLPSDVTGVSVYNQERQDFEFKPGAVFANVVVGDEINRAVPKTQSALLECMEERQVTVDGTTYRLQPPFIVIATQNPIEMEGTYPLPEAQRDRFMARLSMGYPSAVGRDRDAGPARRRTTPCAALSPVADADRRSAGSSPPPVRSTPRTRSRSTSSRWSGPPGRRPSCASGASPRSALHLLRAAKSHAAMEGREHVLPDDVQELVHPVLAHRLLPSADAQLARRAPEEVLSGLLGHVAIPRSRATA